MPPDSHRRPYRTKPCRYYLAGNCGRGDSCTYIHDNASAATEEVHLPTPPTPFSSSEPSANAAGGSSLPSSTSHSGTQSNRGRPQRGEIPCRAWRTDSCTKGEKCWYRHDPEVQAAERRRREEGERRGQEAARREQSRLEQQARERAMRAEKERVQREARERANQERADREARERAEREARELADRRRLEREAEERRVAEERHQEEERARLVAQVKEDAVRTTQRAVLGSIATFAAGLDIAELITSFECCSVRVRNLPVSASDREIRDLFAQQGIDPSRFLLTGVKPAGATKEATIIMDAESGQVLSAGLQELPFRNQLLAFEVGAYNAPGQMGQSTARDVNVLTVSWRAPSVRYVVAYESLDVAEARIRELDGTMQLGRRIKVEKNTPPPNRAVNPNSIRISNLPPSTNDIDVSAFTHSLTVRRLPTRGASIDTPQASQLLRDELDRRIGHGSVLSFDPAPNTGHDHGVVNFRVRFSSWEDAKRAHDFVKDAALPYIGQPRYLKLPAPLAFNLTIPDDQFLAQRTLWTELCSSAKDKSTCSLTVSAGNFQTVRRIQLTGMDRKAVGAMRVRVESLASGEKIDGWHASLAAQNAAAARALVEPTGAYVRADHRQRQIKVYGTPHAIEQARERIGEELARLERAERTTTIPQRAVRFFVSLGVKELEDLLGQDGVRFDVRTRALTVSGSDEAHHAVLRLLAQAANTRAILAASEAAVTCPICFDDVSAPVALGCGHTYCASCLRHFLTTAADSDGDAFPLCCMGPGADGQQCNVPLALPLVERYVPPRTFVRLLDAAFAAHIARRPQELRYCQTADCARVYRAAPADAPAALQCPACLAVVCAACGNEGHEGISCAEHRMQRDPEAQERALNEWIRAQGGNVRKCPECARFLEKNGGCNHMACRCGAHVCWRCMRAFPSEQIYNHMNTAHGGIYEEDADRVVPAIIDGEAVDLRHQREMLVEVERRRAEAQRRVEAQLRADAALAQWRVAAREAEARRVAEAEAQRRAEDRRTLEQWHRLARVRAEEAEAARRRREEAEAARRRQENRSWCTIM